MSRDHTWIQEALDKQIITPDEVKGHPNAHVIRRFIGSQRPPAADFRIRLNPQESEKLTENRQGMRLLDGDILLLCSDGLTDVVPDHDIEGHLRNYAITEAVPRLVDLANQNGGPDNITIIAIQIQALRNSTGTTKHVLMGGLIGLLLSAGLFFLTARYLFQVDHLALPTRAIPTETITAQRIETHPAPIEVNPLPTKTITPTIQPPSNPISP